MSGKLDSVNQGNHSLIVCEGNADFEIPHSIQNFECLSHTYKIGWIIQIHESSSKLRRLGYQQYIRYPHPFKLTLSNLRCHVASHSLPAASIQVSTALARSAFIPLTASSALADLRSKFSSASYNIAAGCDEPGEKTASVESGTFWMKSDVPLESILKPSISVYM